MVKLENVTKVYEEGRGNAFSALEDISLEVGRGECVVLKGISGSGKSTLLALIGAVDRPSSGKIAVDGALISKLPDLHASAYRAQKVGMIFQHFHLIEALSVAENVMVPLITSGLPVPKISEMVAVALKKAQIDHKAQQSVKTLSGGEKQRCAIARALVHDPQLILCDEPTANLDKQNSEKFIEILGSLAAERKTILVATHDPIFETLPFESRVVKVEEGRIRQ